ncbi:MAG: hypothetical protein O3B86_04195 [Planctomycetota bacterium]|nr:hypothetical protein [Planctomycetota bacterium]
MPAFLIVFMRELLTIFHARRGSRVAVAVGSGLIVTVVILRACDTAWLLSFVAILSAVSFSLLLKCYLYLRSAPLNFGPLKTPFLLAHDREMFPRFETLSHSLLRIAQNTDPIFRSVAMQRLDALSAQINHIAEGTIEFRSTETWRLVYEQLLKSPGLHEYRSVAWVRNDNYWQDAGGRQSTRLNAEVQAAGRVTVKRIAILADELWQTDADIPVERVRQWIHEQHVDGIQIKLVRESSLRNESDLLQDMGIYGSRAVGFQEVDEAGQTSRFVLKFDFNEITRAEDCWKRLSVYSTSYKDFLDQLPLDE